MFVDLDWPLKASSLLSASAELLVFTQWPKFKNKKLSWCWQPARCVYRSVEVNKHGTILGPLRLIARCSISPKLCNVMFTFCLSCCESVGMFEGWILWTLLCRSLWVDFDYLFNDFFQNVLIALSETLDNAHFRRQLAPLFPRKWGRKLWIDLQGTIAVVLCGVRWRHSGAPNSERHFFVIL